MVNRISVTKKEGTIPNLIEFYREKDDFVTEQMVSYDVRNL